MPNWIDVLWIGVGSVSTVLAMIHLATWGGQKPNRSHLMLAVLGFTVFFSAYFELTALRATTVEVYAWGIRWATAMTLPMVVATLLVVASVVPGRRRFILVIILLRVLGTVANFTTGDTLGYLEITDLRQVPLPGGEAVAAPVATANPWTFLGAGSNLLLLVYLVDALRRLLRLPASTDRSRRLRMVSGTLAFAALAIVYNNSVILFTAPLPLFISPFYLMMMMAVGREFSNDVGNAAKLVDALRESESSLYETRRDFDLAERVAGLAVWNWAPGSDEIEVSESGRRLADFGPAGRPRLSQHGAWLEPADVPLLRALVRQVCDGKSEELKVELRLRLPSGEQRWIAIYGRARRSLDGAVRELHGVAFDLSAQRELDEQFKVVVGASPAAMLLVGHDGNILMANMAVAQISGYDAAELLGSPIEMLVPMESRGGHVADRRAYASAATPRVMGPRRDVLLLRKDGAQIPVEVSLNAVTLREKSFVVASVIDLTERIAKDGEIASQRAMLAHLSRVDLLSELSGSLAHEINQPLTAILSNAQASMRFMDRPQPDLVEVREGLVQVIESAKRAGEVIRRLRAMLRKEPTDLVMLDVNEVVGDVVRIVRSELIERGIQFVPELGEDLPRVRGDQVQLQQVLINLINNACDAMAGSHGPRRLVIATTRTVGDVVIRVSDSGPGIPEADLQRIFEPFVSTKPSGLGFGLALCTSLVQAQGGRIRASNQPGGGASFHVSLPVPDGA